MKNQKIDKLFENEIEGNSKGYCPLSAIEVFEKYKHEDSFRGQISRMQLEIFRDFAIKLCTGDLNKQHA